MSFGGRLSLKPNDTVLADSKGSGPVTASSRMRGFSSGIILEICSTIKTAPTNTRAATSVGAMWQSSEQSSIPLGKRQ